MTREEFVTVSQKSGFKFLGRRDTRHGTILISERIVKDPADGTKVWETLWSLDRDGFDVAQVVRNLVHEDKNGIWRSTDTPTDREDRTKEAVEAAIQFIEDGLTVGRYA